MKKQITLVFLAFLLASISGATGCGTNGEDTATPTHTFLPTSTPAMELRDVYEQIRPAVVAFAIEEKLGDKMVYRIFGSGFCVDPQGIIVTARHVISEYYQAFTGTPLSISEAETLTPLNLPAFRVVFFRKGRDADESISLPPLTVMVPLEGVELENDIAIVKVPPAPDFWGPEWPYLELGDLGDARAGDEVAASGFPLKWTPGRSALPELSKGIISRIGAVPLGDDQWQETRLVLDIKVNPGNSGGPVFDAASGRVLGLVSYEILRDPPGISDDLRGLLKVPAGIVYCVPSSFIEEKIQVYHELSRSIEPL